MAVEESDAITEEEPCKNTVCMRENFNNSINEDFLVIFTIYLAVCIGILFAEAPVSMVCIYNPYFFCFSNICAVFSFYILVFFAFSCFLVVLNNCFVSKLFFSCKNIGCFVNLYTVFEQAFDFCAEESVSET